MSTGKITRPEIEFPGIDPEEIAQIPASTLLLMWQACTTQTSKQRMAFAVLMYLNPDTGDCDITRQLGEGFSRGVVSDVRARLQDARIISRTRKFGRRVQS